MTEDEIDLALHYVPEIIRAPGFSEWERQFCASILRESRRRRWRPTPRQAPILQDLVDRWKRAALTVDDAPLLEGPADD